MAKLLLRGERHTVELSYNDEGGIDADCLGEEYAVPDPLEIVHSGCTWGYIYDSMDDAVNYAADHADHLRG